uniref:RING-type E3 ubiquitin transferase n=1 Tax=Gouania willdenowi TaxID=441366 RepID=A0A8C5E032_GOUWI
MTTYCKINISINQELILKEQIQVWCAICLDHLNNVAYLDCCLHRFCFPCIKEWANQKAQCPVCRPPAPQTSVSRFSLNESQHWCSSNLCGYCQALYTLSCCRKTHSKV